MDAVVTALDGRQMVAVLLGAAGLVFVAAALVGQARLGSTRLRLVGWPRWFAALFGILLLIPVSTIALSV
jgi:hypothetical protein